MAAMLFGLFYSKTTLRQRVLEIAEALQVSCVLLEALPDLKLKALGKALEQSESYQGQRYSLLLEPDGLDLFDHQLEVKVRADFVNATVAYRVDKGGRKDEMLAKAVGVKSAGLNILDLTAGLGGDAFILSSLGCTVRLVERNPIVRALLTEGLRSAREVANRTQERRLQDTLDRMHLLEGEASTVLTSDSVRMPPDVIYLDPMFPKRSKGALVKKEMQVLQALVGADEDADGLLVGAMQMARKRVVVKRPKMAPCLDDREPSHVIRGKSNRYDIYMHT